MSVARAVKITEADPDSIQLVYADELKGAGYYLKQALARWGIFAKGDCGCDELAAQMNANGPQWCSENRDMILDHMATEAKKRKLVFVRIAAGRLLTWAINKAAT